MDNLSGKPNYLDQMHPRKKEEVIEEIKFTLTEEHITPIITLHAELKEICGNLYDKRKLKVLNDINSVLGMLNKDMEILKQHLN